MGLRNHFFWLAAIVGLSLDQLTKFSIAHSLALTRPPASIALWPGVFHLTYVTNRGAAFSLLSHHGEWLKWLSMSVSLGLIALGLKARLVNRWEQVGYGLILGGALGNGLDRLLAGEVVDFLDFRLIHFPIFNVADVCINIGIVCLLMAAFATPSNRGARE
ncbi:MAG: lipoprotein signal peptidase [Cyanobacteria bacterium REEB459]|nr:lipoprotein signal peptidase [Cyanobacteria bacterium REEB459]